MLKEPIIFKPILQEKIWGGEKLKQLLNKDFIQKNMGESWEISSVSNNISEVSKGSYKGKSLIELIQQFKDDLVGEKVYEQFGNEFPLLIKFIDAKTALSIQLHPNDELAKKRHQSFGKTEMWYIMQADAKAELIVGFNKKVTKKQYVEYLEKKEITKILNVEKVKKGDVYFLETGTVHAIGAGVLLAEIQQTSDITYRIYDWDRKDEQGNERELHTQEALEAIDFKVKKTYKTNYESKKNQSIKIVKCPFFTTNILLVDKEVVVNYKKIDSFVIYMCVLGEVKLAYSKNKSLTLRFGETVLIPNCLNKVKITSKITSELLEVYIE